MIRTGRLSVKDGGKNLGDVGAVPGVLLRFGLLSFLLRWSLSAGDSCVDGGRRVVRAQRFAGDRRMGSVIDEDLVMRVSPVGWWPDDLDAVIL